MQLTALERKWTWAVLVLLVLSLFSSLMTLELRAEEPRRAIVAIEMLLSDQWIIPKINGWIYYNKPPFFNWVLAGCYQLFGSMSEWVVRLPALLAFVATGVLNFFLVRRYCSDQVALLSSLCFWTCADLLFYGAVNSGEIDLFFAFLVYLQAILVFWCYEREKWWQLFVYSYSIAAIGFLTKGLPALAFQGLTVITFLAYHRKWRLLLGWQHILGGSWCLAILGTYFYSYAQQTAVEPFLFNLLNESTQRSATEGKLGEIALHLLEFIPNLIKLTLPWSFVLYVLFRKEVRSTLPMNPLLQFATLFILGNSWIYWISPGALNRYLYPLFPFLCLWLAVLWVRYSNISFPRLLQGVSFLLVLRLVYNLAIMPYQQNASDTLIYRDLSTQILDITQDAPIRFTGEPRYMIADPSFFGMELERDSLKVPPLIPYQLPYYISKTNGHILHYDEAPHIGDFYLTYLDFIQNQPTDILFQFQEKWTNREMVLVRFKEAN